jgi:putative DNA primase/helicase
MPMTGSRPLEGIPYGVIADARRGARSRTVDIPCPVCAPEHKGESARRKVMRTWPLDNGGIAIYCARCNVEGWVAPDAGTYARPAASVSEANVDDERERSRRNLELAAQIWRESYPIAGTAGEIYLARRGIDLAAVPDYGGLRFHPRCPWGGGETMPCVVARFTDTLNGEPRAIHRRPIDGRITRSLGPVRGCVIRLWPDDAVTTGLVIGEGVETVLAAATRVVHRGTLLRPAWAAGSAGNLAELALLPGIEALTILVDNDASTTGQAAAYRCAQRWNADGREVTRLIPRRTGTDFNDITRMRDAS